MPRPIVPQQSLFPYHVTARCINKEWFSLPMDQVWEIMGHQLYFVHHAFEAKIYSFTLMSNHWHLMLRTPRANLSEIMQHFMRETSRALTRAGNRINQTYGGRHYRTIINKDHYFNHAYKYGYRNPVEAGIVSRVEEYKYSTLYGLLGQSHLIIPVEEDLTLFNNIDGTVNWLNKKPEPKNWEAVKQALRRPTFKLAADKSTKKENLLEFDML
jgi:putative transposase